MEVFFNRALELLLYDERVFYTVITAIGLLVLLLLYRLLHISKTAPTSKTRIERRGTKPGVKSVTQTAEEEKAEEVFLDPDEEQVLAKTRNTAQDEDTPSSGIVLPTHAELDESGESRPDTEVVYRRLSADSDIEREAELEYLTPPPDQRKSKPVIDRISEIEKEEEEEKPLPPVDTTPRSWNEGLEKTRKTGFISKLNGLVFGRKQIDEEILEQLEEILYTADIGPTAGKLFDIVAQEASRKELRDPERLMSLLKEEIYSILKKAQKPYSLEGHKPQIIMMVGVNGVGKTTTIGKLAWQYRKQGKSVMLAAADTFRAAAVEQLSHWGERNDVPVIKGDGNTPPASVVFNAVNAAKARDVDILIVDTAGRLHTKYNLMEEMKKMAKVVEKAIDRGPDQIWLVIDSNTGQNAINQAQKFHEDIGLTGLILTKLDGTAKGGVVIAITDQLGLPIHYIGIGEGIQDLRPFDARAFTEALF